MITKMLERNVNRTAEELYKLQKDDYE